MLSHGTSPYPHVCRATQGCVHIVHMYLKHTKCRDMAVDGCFVRPTTLK